MVLKDKVRETFKQMIISFLIYTVTLGIGGSIWFFEHNTWEHGHYRFWLIFLIALACIILVYVPKFSKFIIIWTERREEIGR